MRKLMLGSGLVALLLAGCASVPNQGSVVAPLEPIVVQRPLMIAPLAAEVKPVQVQLRPVALTSAPAPLFTAKSGSPSSYTSLQPFQAFARGAGEGFAYEYRPRTKAQFVALLRNPTLAKKEMRVTCDVLVRQMMEGHPTLPFEGCEGAAATIERDSDFAVVSCKDAMFARGSNWLVVTNQKGSAFGMWHRKCLVGEQVLVYKGQPLISLTCLNPVVPVEQLAPPKQACVYVPFTVTGRETVGRFALVGPSEISPNDDCLALKVPGKGFVRWWKDKCADVHCDFSAPAQVIGQRIRALGSEDLEPGEYVLRLPAYVAAQGSQYVTLLCVERVRMPWPEMPQGQYTAAQRDAYIQQRDRWIEGHSDTTGVRWHDYRSANGRTEARVYYAQTDVPPGLTVSQSDLYWHWGRWMAQNKR